MVISYPLLILGLLIIAATAITINIAFNRGIEEFKRDWIETQKKKAALEKLKPKKGKKP